MGRQTLEFKKKKYVKKFFYKSFQKGRSKSFREFCCLKFLHLKEPNPTRESVISIVNNLPEEFKLDAYIDYEKQFVKAFFDPIKVVLDCVGWKAEKTSTLERFFG